MGWIVFVLFLAALIAVALAFGRLQNEAGERAAGHGPKAELSTAPTLAQGRLTWTSATPGDLSNPAYLLEIRGAGDDLLGRFESTLGLGSLRSRGEVALTVREGQVSGRLTNGTTTSVVEGRLEADGAEIAVGLDVAGPLGQVRERVAFDVDGSKITVRGVSEIAGGELDMQPRRLTGRFEDRIGRLRVLLNHRGEAPGERLALIVLLAVMSVHTLES